ncbi:ABC transporter ATP-binding protein YtrB [Peptococcaceae bacterium CEB3]|nr:ABC transporter ATP-binding protein YtrB [Peptococcaceae bacterium CEB3]
MELLSVHNLNKKYEKFALKNVSFSLEKGYIMGFVGRNGAGKTTMLKTMLNLVHADGGTVSFLGKDYFSDELACKQKIGLMFGDIFYYPKQRLRTITNVVKRFYNEWDDAAYEGYLARFDLDPEKKVEKLSTGMKVKYSLALALSHHAQLLILDEPTSGLDPVSRDDMLELFQELIEGGETSILFSTQITSDLEKCADFITYIKDGAIIASTEKDEFLDSYKIVKGSGERLTNDLRHKLIGCKENSLGFSGLVKTTDLRGGTGLEVSAADVESIMIYYEKGRAE